MFIIIAIIIVSVVAMVCLLLVQNKSMKRQKATQEERRMKDRAYALVAFLKAGDDMIIFPKSWEEGIKSKGFFRITIVEVTSTEIRYKITKHILEGCAEVYCMSRREFADKFHYSIFERFREL